MTEMEKQFHNVLILAGTGDRKSSRLMGLATKHWENHGIRVTVCNVGWQDGSLEFKLKLEEIKKLIDQLSKKGPVSIIGCSAGGSAAFNAFLEQNHIIQKAISICARLRSGKGEFRPRSKLFEQSVLFFEGQESRIPDELKKRMMTVSAQFGDPRVPEDTSHLEGAYNTKIRLKGHGFSIAMALTLLKKPVIDFIKLSRESSEK